VIGDAGVSEFGYRNAREGAQMGAARIRHVILKFDQRRHYKIAHGYHSVNAGACQSLTSRSRRKPAERDCGREGFAFGSDAVHAPEPMAGPDLREPDTGPGLSWALSDVVALLGVILRRRDTHAGRNRLRFAPAHRYRRSILRAL
jgi:hypothetical protein